jgi:hypothetical protein
MEESESDDDGSQIEVEKEPPIKKEKIKIKEIVKKHEPIKKADSQKKEEVSSPKITVTIPSSSLSNASTTQKASPAAATVAPIPKLVIPPEADDGGSSSSSSSDDQPIASKDLLGAKRKVEVLSKESGKIGVTIKKTPTTTTSKPLLSPKIKIEKKPIPLPAPIPEPKEEEQDSSATESSSASSVVEKKEKEPTVTPAAMIPDTNVVIKSEEPKTPEKAPESPETNSTKENKFTNLMTNSNMKLLTSPKSAHPKLWLPKAQSTSDQVFITDVTVNLETVTIRECKTERGFFKSRQDMERNLTKAQ